MPSATSTRWPRPTSTWPTAATCRPRRSSRRRCAPRPERMAIRTKLLEVYAKRRDTKGFELLADAAVRADAGRGRGLGQGAGAGPADRPRQPAVPAGRPARRGAGATAASWSSRWAPRTMPQSVLPCRRSSALESAAGATLDGGTDLDLDLDLDLAPPSAPRRALEATRPFAAGGAAGRRRVAGLRSAAGLRRRRPRRGRRRRAAAVPTALDFDLGDMSLDDDAGGARRAGAGAAGGALDFGDFGLDSRPAGAERRRRRPAGAQARTGRGVPPDRRHGRRARPARGSGGQGRRRAEGQGPGHARPTWADSRPAPARRRLPARPGARRMQRWRWASATAAAPTTAGRASPTAARCRTSSKRALAHFADQPVRTRVRRPHRHRRACAEPGRAPRHRRSQREPFSWVRGTNRYLPRDIARAVVPAGRRATSTPATARAAGATATCCCESPVRPALEHGLVGWVFRPLDGEAMRAAAALLIGEHDFSAFRAAECQAPSPVKTLRAHRHRRGAAPTGASISTPAPSCTTWCATSWAACWRWAAAASRPAGWPRCWPRADRDAGGADLRRPTACTSSARTTMRGMRIPEHTAGHGLAALTPLSRPAHPHQDLRPDARGRCRRRRARPAPTRSASCSTPRARATSALARAAELARAPAALRDAGAAVRQRRRRRGARGRCRPCRRRCCSSTATRRPAQCDAPRPALPARRAHGAGLRFARLRARVSRAHRPCCSTPMSRATAAAERSSIGHSFLQACPFRSFCLVG